MMLDKLVILAAVVAAALTEKDRRAGDKRQRPDAKPTKGTK